MSDFDNIKTPPSTDKYRRGWDRIFGKKSLDTIMRADGKPLRCECGGNVFKRRGTKYTCNSCGAVYMGENISEQ